MAESSGVLEKVLLVIAVAFGTINVIGGFLVADRMLGMFKVKDPRKVEEVEESRAVRGARPDGFAGERVLAERRLHRRLLPTSTT